MGDALGKALQIETLKTLAQRNLIGKNLGPSKWQHHRRGQIRKDLKKRMAALLQISKKEETHGQ
jgi:hypothetical protein